MGPQKSRHQVRTLFSAASLLTACVMGNACIEGVVDVPEDEGASVDSHEQEATGTVTPAVFYLELAGGKAIPVTKPSGGAAVAEVVTLSKGTGNLDKAVQAINYEPISLEVGVGHFEGIRALIEAAQDGKAPRADGFVTARGADASTTAWSFSFAGAAIDELTLPALHATSKDSAKAGLKLLPQATKQLGNAHVVTPGVGGPKQNVVMASNFRVSIDTLESKDIVAVDGITLKFPTAGDGPRGLPGRTEAEISDLKIKVPAQSIESWLKYADRVLKDGKADNKDELSGSIELLDQNRQLVLATISLQGLGLRRLAPAADGNYDATFYVEEVLFDVAKPAK